jgi:hypothetical protein
MNNRLRTGESGAANGSFQVSDNDSLLGLHQAYFTLKNFANTSLDLKMGRQQIVLDGHRYSVTQSGQWVSKLTMLFAWTISMTI